MKFPHFVGGTNEAFSTIGDTQRTINLYPHIIGAAGKNSIVLRGTPGLSALVTVAAKTSVRGMFLGDQADTAFFYAAIDDKLYKVKNDGTAPTEVGALSNDNKPIKWATGGSGRDTVIVSNSVAYSLISGTLAAISDLSAKSITAIASMDNYWIAGLSDGTYYISGLNDPTSWDALDFEVADDASQPVLNIQTSNHQLWLLGRTRTNVWYNSGATFFPFEQVKGVQIRFGCMAPDSPAIVDNSITWLARNEHGGPCVVAARNYSPQRISTPAIESMIAALSTHDDAIGFGIENEGHVFYFLTFPTGNLTLCYDFTTNMWHERDYWTGTVYQAHLAKCHVISGGKHYVGARNAGTIYLMSNTAYLDGAQAIRRLRRSGHLSEENELIRYASLELDLEKGLGGTGTNPTASLRWSDDGGKTWTSPLTASIGETPLYGIEVIWYRLGAGRDRVFEVTSTAAIRHCWIDAFLKIS